MPTPFMHMALAERLLADPVLPPSAHDLLAENWGAFLLGSIAPDARVSSGLTRVSTHFFEYLPQVDPPAVQAMFTQHPDLQRAQITDAGRACFVAGYAAHLAMDEVWSTHLLFPAFFHTDWGDNATKLTVLHILLARLDRRDRQLLPDTHYNQLASTTPIHWLPFIDDDALIVWRDTIASHFAPGALSLTIEILAKRVSMTTEELTALVNDDHSHLSELMVSQITPEKLAEVEQAMYNACRETVIAYLSATTSQEHS